MTKYFCRVKIIHRPRIERDRLMLAELDADGIPEVSVNDVDDINFMIEKVQHKFQSDIANAKKKI